MPIITNSKILVPRRDEPIVDNYGRATNVMSGFIESLQQSLDSINQGSGNADGYTQVVVSGNYTASGSMIIICSDSADITLPSVNLTDAQKIIIKRTNQQVRVFSARPIDNLTLPLIISRDYTSLSFVYSTVLSSWFLV